MAMSFVVVPGAAMSFTSAPPPAVARAYPGKNDLKHAIADFDQALKLAPSLADVQQEREHVQAMLAKGR
jgi:hypothetical protein